MLPFIEAVWKCEIGKRIEKEEKEEEEEEEESVFIDGNSKRAKERTREHVCREWYESDTHTHLSAISIGVGPGE